jgi:outer membrane protein insertion porin family
MKILMKIWFFLFFSVLTLEATVIKEIKYDGMLHISEAVAKRMLKFDVGDNISEKEIDKAIKTFFKQGYFEDIYADVDEEVLTFHFKEKPIISKIELEGYKENDDDIKDTVLQIKKGTLYDERKIEAAKQRLVDSLSQEGKLDSVVEVKIDKLDNGSIKVTFLVNEGEEIIIESLQYEGVKELATVKSEDFNTVIANKEHQFMGWFWGRNDGKMALAELQYDPLRIRDYYMQHGYLDAYIDEPFVRVDFDHYTAQMSYQIFEGEIYRIRAINIFQERKVIDNAILLKKSSLTDIDWSGFCSQTKTTDIMKLEVNQAFNIKTFREDSDRIKTKIADLGYAFVQVTPDLKKDKKAKSVEVIYHISPGQKVHIRNVIIEGNNRTLDRIIRRELYLAPGDMYNLTDLRDSRNALGRTGYFESNIIEEKRIDEKTMDLIVKVKEAPTGNIQLGGGYGSFGGLLLSVAVNDRNVFGSGINVGLRLEKSERSNNYSFNISNPRLNDSDFSGNFSVYKSRNEFNDYTVNTDGIGVGTGHRLTRFLTGYLGYSYSNNAYEDINQTSIDQAGLTLFFQSYNKSALTASLSYDDTDDYYLPRSGKAISQSIEKAGTLLGAEADFYKSRTTFSCYKGLEELTTLDIIARYKARLYFAEETGFLPLAERFYLGGIGSVRGYESYSISPTVVDNGVIRRVGGDKSFSNSLELSFPLIPKAKMRLAGFYDWGVIQGKGSNANGAIDNQTLIRSSYGVSLEWFSPVGPIQLVFANPIAALPGDRTSYFEFTIGQRF